MDIAASILTSIAGTAGSAATAAGSAASGLSAFLPSASLVSGILSGSASLLQMTQARAAAEEKASSLRIQADDTRTEIGQENVRQAERASSLKKSLLASIGERDAAYAASGVDLTFGTPAIARDQAATEAERTLAIDDATTAGRVTRLNERANSLRAMAASARRTGGQMAAIAGIEAAGRFLRRG